MIETDIRLMIANEFLKESKKIYDRCLSVLGRLEKNETVEDDFVDLFSLYDVMATSSRSANLSHCEIHFRAIAEYSRFLSQSEFKNMPHLYLQPLLDTQEIIHKCCSEIHESRILNDQDLVKQLSSLVKLMANYSYDQSL